MQVPRNGTIEQFVQGWSILLIINFERPTYAAMWHRRSITRYIKLLNIRYLLIDLDVNLALLSAAGDYSGLFPWILVDDWLLQKVGKY